MERTRIEGKTLDPSSDARVTLHLVDAKRGLVVAGIN
jgi:hypothetical protein